MDEMIAEVEGISLKTILVPLDGSEPSFRAAKYAIKIAKMAGANLIAFHAVIKLPPYNLYITPDLVARFKKSAKEDAEKWYSEVKTISEKLGVNVASETVFDVTSIADFIINYAKEHNIDLIVIGIRGMTGERRFVLGSVARNVVTHAMCPVLVAR